MATRFPACQSCSCARSAYELFETCSLGIVVQTFTGLSSIAGLRPSRRAAPVDFTPVVPFCIPQKHPRQHHLSSPLHTPTSPTHLHLRAVAGYDCEGQPPPAPSPSPEPAPPPHHHHHPPSPGPGPEPAPAPHHHHHHPSPEPGPEPTPAPPHHHHHPSPEPGPEPTPAPPHHHKHPSPEPGPEPTPAPPHHHKHHHKHHEAPTPSSHHRHSHHGHEGHDDYASEDIFETSFDDDEGSSAGAEVGKKHERPGFECHFPNEAYCDIHSNCEWCTTGGVAGDACYTRTQASMLPKAIFKCSATPSLSKPLLECHYDNEAKCVVHPNCEWCSTSDKVRLDGCTYVMAFAVCDCDAACCMRSCQYAVGAKQDVLEASCQ